MCLSPQPTTANVGFNHSLLSLGSEAVIMSMLQAMVHLECDGRAERLTSPEKQAAGGTCQHASSNPPAGRPA